MRKRTPQEKKALSYAKDRRNCYGENDKSSRESIRLNKVLRTRAHRRNVNQILQSEAPGVDAEESELIELKVRGKRRRQWHKFPDKPLGEVVRRMLEWWPRRHKSRMRREESEKSNKNA